MAPITLVYYGVAGRGELSRLIARVGGIGDDGIVFSSEMPEGVTKADCGSTGSVPVLIDGDRNLRMNESGAIEHYLSLIAPLYRDLTPTQRAKDSQLCHMKESCLSKIAGIIFSIPPGERSSTPSSSSSLSPEAARAREALAGLIDRQFTAIETILPPEGFVNGLDIPTPADLAILNLCEGRMPFGFAHGFAGTDLAGSYPKLHGILQRTKAFPAVAEYLTESTTLRTPVPGF